MDRTAPAGLEVKQSTGPEVVPPPDSHKYFAEAPESNHRFFPPQDQSYQSEAKKKSQSQRKGFWVLAVIAIVCLAVALGAGLGAGLAAQHKPSESASQSSSTSAISASNARVTVTQIGDTSTITPAPNTPPSQTCPAANGSTYTASNKPLITDVSQITQTSLAFEILCDTNTAEGGSVLDLQLITNVSTLNDCMNTCALYNFQTKQRNFPAHGCTGVSWGYSEDLKVPHSCWLKNGVSLGSPNNTDTYPGYNGAVLLNN